MPSNEKWHSVNHWSPWLLIISIIPEKYIGQRLFIRNKRLDRYSCSDQDQVVQSLRSLIKTDSKTKDNSFRVVFSQTALRCAGPGPFKNVQLFTIISGRKRLTCSLTGWAVQRGNHGGVPSSPHPSLPTLCPCGVLQNTRSTLHLPTFYRSRSYRCLTFID